MQGCFKQDRIHQKWQQDFHLLGTRCITLRWLQDLYSCSSCLVLTYSACDVTKLINCYLYVRFWHDIIGLRFILLWLFRHSVYIVNYNLIKYNDFFYSEPFLNKLMWIQMKFGNGRSTDWLENMINVQDFQHLWLWLNSSIRLQNRSGRKLAEEKRKIVNSLPAYFFILINNNVNYILFWIENA